MPGQATGRGRVLYQLVRRELKLVRAHRTDGGAKHAEILVLAHQLAVGATGWAVPGSEA